jgi:hypothetical protein
LTHCSQSLIGGSVCRSDAVEPAFIIKAVFAQHSTHKQLTTEHEQTENPLLTPDSPITLYTHVIGFGANLPAFLNIEHCCIATCPTYPMSWAEQRRIELRRMRVADGGTVYSKLEEAFYFASRLGWSKDKFMLAARDVAKAEKIPKHQEESNDWYTHIPPL